MDKYIRYATLALAVACVGFASPLLAKDSQQAPAGPPVATFTAGSTAPLAATRRVAISQVVVSFQTSTGVTIDTSSRMGDFAKHGLGGLFRHDRSEETAFMRLELDPELATRIADSVYAKLKAEIAAAGYEVVPEAELLASPGYQAMLKEAGYSNASRYFNGNGDTLLVAPATLSPYMPYAIETGNFNVGSNPHYIPGWVTAFGSSSTPGGPKNTLSVGVWKLPDLEAKLASELNATVVKANYVLTLGQVDLSVSGHDYTAPTAANDGSFSTDLSGKANAALGLRGGQSRIAFRLASGKSQKAAKGTPWDLPKDGDVVLTVDHDVPGLAGFFALSSGGKLEKVVSINDAAAFEMAATNMIDIEQKRMLDLVRR